MKFKKSKNNKFFKFFLHQYSSIGVLNSARKIIQNYAFSGVKPQWAYFVRYVTLMYISTRRINLNGCLQYRDVLLNRNL